MKICLINNIFFPYSRGGADKVTKVMADGFLGDGDEVIIIATQPRKNKIQSEKYKSYFLNSLFFNLNKMPKIIRFVWHIFDMFNVINFFKIKKILKREKPDVVITHNLKGIGLLTPCTIHKQNIKHIHVLHDIQLIHPSGLFNYGEEEKINSPFCKTYSFITSFLFRHVDTVISPSRWLLDLHREKKLFIKTKSKVIPNPIRLSQESQIVLNKSFPTFVFVGEIEKHKGVEFLLKTIHNLNKYKVVSDILFIGEGKYTPKLKHEANNCNYIKYLGKLDNKDVLSQIKTAHALIMPSLCYENSPTVIYEACSQGTPVIASRIGGITELVHELGGILFNPGDKKDLTNKIKFLLNNYVSEKQKASSGRKKLEKYQTDYYIKKIKNVLK